MPPRAIPLSRLNVGRTASVCHVGGRPEHVHRLAEFGLCRGSRVRMFRIGNPCIIHLGGSKVCLRIDDVAEIFVEPSPD